MKLIVDNQVLFLLMQAPEIISKHPSLSDPDCHIEFKWPSLLEYLGWGDLYARLPPFDSTQPLFTASVATLSANENMEMVFYVYDRLFTELLTQIKALPEINASVLLETLKMRRYKIMSLDTRHLFSTALSTYEHAFTENPVHAMHDLVLYLAWDRMCVWIGSLFNHQSTDLHFNRALSMLKGCLVESYQHIAHQKRTAPGIYRMLEALVFYQMREENLNQYSDEEWAIVSQSFPVLKGQNELADFFYIDDGVSAKNAFKHESVAEYMTLDSLDRTATRLVLAKSMMKQLKKEFEDWDFVLDSKKIIYLHLDYPHQ